MNLVKFLKKVDTISSTMEKGQLVSFVHDIARTLPEDKRSDFLEKMANNSSLEEKELIRSKEDKKKFENLKELLEQIEDEELCLEGDINQEYDDWYNSSADEFLFEDPEGIGTIIENACLFIHESIDKQLYVEGNEIAEILIGLKIMVEGNYQDYADDTIEIADMKRYHLCDIHYEKVVEESLYLAYCVTALEERAEILYYMIENTKIRNISLENIMQCGEELQEFEDFLSRWITHLGKQKTHVAKELLEEAINMMGDPNSLLENARTHYEQHPELFDKYISENKNTIDFNELIVIGQEALEKINQQHRIRSSIALQLADITMQKKGEITDAVEQYWIESFRSDTRAIHFMRIYMECKDFSVWKEKLQEINHHQIKKGMQKDKYYLYHSATYSRTNEPNYNEAYLIAILNGEYQFVKEKGMNFTEALGWSNTYMKIGLSVFLLLVYDSEVLQYGGRAMLETIANSISFSINGNGAGIEKLSKDRDYLWQCLLQSKSQNSISETQQQKYILWVEKLIEKRVKGIVEGNHTRYYKECAEYIATLGEVKESRGIANAKQNVMLGYKKAYSRRRGLHEQLRNCGMKDK